MYELVKQKSTGFRIILGIIVCVFISGILKMAFNQKPSSFNDELIKTANEINLHAPIVIDSTIRFDRVDALSGNVFRYEYTLLVWERAELDTMALNSLSRDGLIKKVKGNPKLNYFRDNKVEIQSRWVDKNGNYVACLSIPFNEY